MALAGNFCVAPALVLPPLLALVPAMLELEPPLLGLLPAEPELRPPAQGFGVARSVAAAGDVDAGAEQQQ